METRMSQVPASRRERTIHPTASILFEALSAGRITRAEVTRRLDLRNRQSVTNWLVHGIPPRHLPGVAALCGLSTDEYRAKVGLVTALESGAIEPVATSTEQLVANFENLPAGLQLYVLRKVKEWRKYADTLPSFLRDAVKPPEDVGALRAWELEFFKAMEKQALGDLASESKKGVNQNAVQIEATRSRQQHQTPIALSRG